MTGKKTTPDAIGVMGWLRLCGAAFPVAQTILIALPG